MKMTMTIRLLLVSFLALMLPATVTGLAWFLVESGKPKCMSVEVAGGTFLRIHFEAPGTIDGWMID